MTPRRGSCPLLLFCLMGLLVTCAQEPDTAGQNTTGGWKGRPCPASPGEGGLQPPQSRPGTALPPPGLGVWTGGDSMGHLGEQRALPHSSPSSGGIWVAAVGGCPPSPAREPSGQVAPMAQPLSWAFSSGCRESWHLSPGRAGDAQWELHGRVPVGCQL